MDVAIVVFSTPKAIDSVCDAAIVEDEPVAAQVITVGDVASVRAVIGASIAGVPVLLVAIVMSTLLGSSAFPLETSCSSVFVPVVVS